MTSERSVPLCVETSKLPGAIDVKNQEAVCQRCRLTFNQNSDLLASPGKPVFKLRTKFYEHSKRTILPLQELTVLIGLVKRFQIAG